ncbi:hypothetical protein, conserved [Eimeria tenella]|uniref:Uncharacterized protein n=1 Tax=Eimeria tenella TaxID=5802 RepID=U6KLU8_EIMTE|nr:hypothetical protein, conserved [Eimeria tenella]CDJ39077.1 hypothetical protein, conserved [Eimeria tenella]|eukprot:XP_013229832.1 hypothetical protein, conserved [Eimeria tenella]
MLLITALSAHPIQPLLRRVLKNIPLSCPQKKKASRVMQSISINTADYDILSRTGMKEPWHGSCKINKRHAFLTEGRILTKQAATAARQPNKANQAASRGKQSICFQVMTRKHVYLHQHTV